MALEGSDDVKWVKRYAISCMVALLIFSGVEGYWRSNEFRVGTVIGLSVIWPISATIAIGATAG